MTLRLADMTRDADQILSGVRDFISRMDFTGFKDENDDAFEAHILRVLAHDFIETYILDVDGVIVAGIGIAYVPFLWNTEKIQADELFWWAAPTAPKTAALRVLRFALGKAKVRADILTFKALTSSPEGVSRVYGKMGLRKVETSFMGMF